MAGFSSSKKLKECVHLSITLTEQDVAIAIEALDIGLKTHGLRVVYTVIELTQLLEKPVEINEETKDRLYEFTDEQKQQFSIMMDAAVKVVGINGGAEKVIQIVQKVNAA